MHTTIIIEPANPVPQPSLQDLTHCFYLDAGRWPMIDGAFMYDGQYYSYYNRKTLPQMQAEYGQALRVVEYGWAFAQEEERAKTPVEEISNDDFEDALNVLPPAAWVTQPGVQSFHCCELYSGRVSTIYVQVQGRSFKFRDVVSLPHSERVARCVAWLRAH